MHDEETMRIDNKSATPLAIQIRLRELLAKFNLRTDMQNENAVVEDIIRASEITGTNLWLLISAILIASVGLNVNSTAVIIGAMLVSPLMGPILGVALGVSTYRFYLIHRSARSLGFAVLASVVASTTYFLVSPMSEAQSELLARTTPTIWDVMIAFVGGLAGMVGISRRQPGNVIPGVAIATALMPPLCTAGYGLATMQSHIFLGAFYLFFINSVFICLGGILLLKYLRFQRVQTPERGAAVFVRRATIGIAVLTAIPSIFLTYKIVQESMFRNAANRFLSSELNPLEIAVVGREVLFKPARKIQITYLGQPLSAEKTSDLKDKLSEYGLERTQLILKSATQESPEQALKTLKSGLVEELLQKTQASSDLKDARIKELESEVRKNEKNDLAREIGRELAAQLPELKNYSLARAPIYLPDGTQAKDQWLLTGKIKTGRMLPKAEKQRIENWLKVRFEAEETDLRFF